MIEQMDARIRRALGNVRQAFRGVITLVRSAGNVQIVSGDGVAGEQLQDNELFQQYGYTSSPPEGTMAIVLPIGGKTAHGIIIATEHVSYRLKGLKGGEVALYTDEGDSIVLKRGRLIEVTTQTLKVTASAGCEFITPAFKVTGGSVVVDEDITDRAAHADSRTMHGMRTWAQTHTHHENDAHGETNPPTQAV